MFLDEARLAAQLQHPNIAQVYDIGKLGDSYFFTMEYVHGETVRALLHRSHALRRPVHLGSVLTIVAGAAAGLQHAHDRIGIDGRALGIVHRDISPSNLMVSFEGGVKVVDFGVAKAADRLQETRSGTVKGKISYLSPEQCRGSDVDRRSDLFSLGIVMWEMLTTERLYKRASDFDNMSAIVTELPSPPSSRRPDVPPEIDAIAMKLLAKDPAERYQTAADLIEDIEQHAMRTGSMLSPTSLGRYLRELFGQRPEPWIEMEVGDAHDGVTVASEPIPSDLEASAAVDLQLATVLDLSSASQTSGPIEQRFVPSPLALPTLQMPAVQLRAAVSQSTGPRVVIADTGPRAAIPATGSLPALALDQLPTTAVPKTTAPMKLRRVLVPTLVAGTIVGIGIAIVASRTSSAPPLAAVIAVDSRTDASGSPAIDPPPIADPRVAAAADAMEAVAGPADAAAAIGPSDAMGAVAAPAVAAPPDAVVRRPAGKDLAELVQSGRYDEALVMCASRSGGDRARLCTIVACKEHREPLARHAFAAVGASARASVIAACRTQGLDLEPAVAAPHDAGIAPRHADAACDDPMACQH
jgi:serine/threonine protein kinase